MRVRTPGRETLTRIDEPMNGGLDAWPPLPPMAYMHRRVPQLPFPLGERNVVLTSRARAGIFAGVQALGLRPGDEVLAPAYHHGSEIEALVRAGLEVRFYDSADTLEPHEGELDDLISPRTRALYLIHYLGFPQDARRWRDFCDRRGFLLLEDAAQAWLGSDHGRPLGSSGDLAVFCLYKSFGLPDGAALVLTGGAVEARSAGDLGLSLLARRHAAWLVGRSGLLTALSAFAARGTNDVHVDEFGLGELDGPRPSSRFLAERISGYRVAAARRSNYRVLLEELEHLVPPPFQEVPEGASPFAFPVATGAKRELIDRLHDGRIRPLDFWSFPHPALPERRFPHAAERRATTVCLPVHQELRPEDVERIVRIVRGRERPRHNGERVEWYHDLDAVRDEWRTLAEQTRSIFATWEWAALWWDCFGGDRRPLLGLCRRDSGEPFALLPLYAARERPLKVLRFIGHSTADELGPVCAPADRAGAGRALRTALGQCGADILLADRLPGVEHWRSLLGGGQLLKREAAPVIEWNEGWASYLRSRSRNFREQVRRRARRLGEAHKVEFRLSSGGDRNPDVDILFLLHTARWDAETTFTRHERFHREFAAAAAREGWLRLWVLEVDGVPAAAWYGFRFSGVESYFQLGRDPRFAKASVGFVLLAHTVEQALDDRITEYRFLWGAEPYKYRFATGDRGLETVAVARGIASQAAVASGRLVRPLAWTRAVVRAGLSAGSD